MTHSIRSQLRGCAGGIPGALWASDQLDLYPMVMIRIHISPEYCRAVNGIDDGVDLAIIKQIAESSSARRNHDR